MDRELEQLLTLTSEYAEDDEFGTGLAEADELDDGFENGPNDAELVDDSDEGDDTGPADEDLDYDEATDEVDDDDYDEDEDYDVEEDDEDY